MPPFDPSSAPIREAPRARIRRVYKTVAVDERAADNQEIAFRVLLDGKPTLTPLRNPLATKHRALAEAVAAEWDAQNPLIDPETMPLTRLVSTAIDCVVPQRATLIGELMNYVDADMLCYRASYPADLKARQQAAWQPVLDWLDATIGIALQASEGFGPHRQSAAAVAALKAAFESLDDGRLTALQAAAAITGSLALALALTHGCITAAEAFTAASLDESYQMEKWGEDEMAQARRRFIERDLLAIGDYLRLLTLP